MIGADLELRRREGPIKKNNNKKIIISQSSRLIGPILGLDSPNLLG